jgi:acyl-CoA thioesterase-2
MPSAVQDLLAVLDLERLEVNLFRGRSPQIGRGRVFGGQVIGQALVAACRTLDASGRPPHSLHAYFLLAGDPAVPIIYEVDRIRDGTSFTTRRVVAIQHGEAIFSMAASFHRDEPGMSHQAEMPTVPRPEALASEADIKGRLLPMMPDPVRRYYERERPIELRPVEFDRYLGRKIENGRFHVWIRATERLPDEPAIHQCVLAYASDMMLLDAALIPHGRTVFEQSIMAASLDHALWFHRPFRADDWLLYAQDSPNLSGSRGFSRGLIFAREGTLVASVTQEGVLRERRTNDGRQMTESSKEKA